MRDLTKENGDHRPVIDESGRVVVRPYDEEKGAYVDYYLAERRGQHLFPVRELTAEEKGRLEEAERKTHMLWGVIRDQPQGKGGKLIVLYCRAYENTYAEKDKKGSGDALHHTLSHVGV